MWAVSKNGGMGDLPGGWERKTGLQIDNGRFIGFGANFDVCLSWASL
jgi:hypothetical protein